MTTIEQQFILYNTTLQQRKQGDNNLSYLSEKELLQQFENYKKKFAWGHDHRIVAVGNAGDSIIYENGRLMQVSDSG